MLPTALGQRPLMLYAQVQSDKTVGSARVRVTGACGKSRGGWMTYSGLSLGRLSRHRPSSAGKRAGFPGVSP